MSPAAPARKANRSASRARRVPVGLPGKSLEDFSPRKARAALLLAISRAFRRASQLRARSNPRDPLTIHRTLDRRAGLSPAEVRQQFIPKGNSL